MLTDDAKKINAAREALDKKRQTAKQAKTTKTKESQKENEE